MVSGSWLNRPNHRIPAKPGGGQGELNEPLPVLMEGIPDDAELARFNEADSENTEDAETAETDAAQTNAEKLYDELLAAAEALNSQPSTLNLQPSS